MRTVALVQSRVGSTRLPRKALADVAGKPLIQHVLERAAAAITVDEVVLATTRKDEDDQLAELARSLGYRVYRGDEDDVLRRMREAAEWFDAQVVVRVCGDCPALDPDVLDEVVVALGDNDFSSNCCQRRTYPKGHDVEAMHLDTLKRIDRLARSAEAREHVTWFAYRERPDLFVLKSVEDSEDRSDENLSVDTARDLERVRELSTR